MAQFVPAAELGEAENRQDRRAGDEDHGLDGVVVRHGPHAAQRRVEARQEDHQHGADPKAVDVPSSQVQIHFRQQDAEDHAAGKNADGDLGDHEDDQGNDREHVARGR